MYKEIARIKRSTTKLRILKTLSEPRIPSEIATKLNKYVSSISKSLKHLVKDGMVRCINLEDHNFRFFELTPKGKKILKTIEAIEKL